MKKAYSKPEIAFEDFTLSTAIAGDCGTTTNTPSAQQCGVDMGGSVVFTTGVTGCQTQIEDGGMGDGLCYHVPSAGSALFNS